MDFLIFQNQGLSQNCSVNNQQRESFAPLSMYGEGTAKEVRRGEGQIREEEEVDQ